MTKEFLLDWLLKLPSGVELTLLINRIEAYDQDGHCIGACEYTSK